MSSEPSSGVLLGDVGGTHTRLAMMDGGGGLHHIEIVDNAPFRELLELIQSYLSGGVATTSAIHRAVLAVATLRSQAVGVH